MITGWWARTDPTGIAKRAVHAGGPYHLGWTGLLTGWCFLRLDARMPSQKIAFAVLMLMSSVPTTLNSLWICRGLQSVGPGLHSALNQVKQSSVPSNDLSGCLVGGFGVGLRLILGLGCRGRMPEFRDQSLDLCGFSRIIP